MRIPVYDQSTVKPTAQVAPFASGPGVDLSGLSRGLEKVTDNIFSMAVHEKKKADEKALYDFRVKLDDHESLTAFGDGKTPGFLQTRGEAAPKQLDTTLNSFTQGLDKLREAAQNDEQRHAFDLMAEERKRTVERSFRTHASAQFQTAVDASQEALEKSTLRNIANYFNDDARFGQELAVGRQAILEDAANKGQAPEVKKFRLETFTSLAYGQRIDRMASISAVEAQKFLDENKDLMVASDVARYQKELKPLITKQSGMAAALTLASTFNTATTAGDLWTARDKALTEARTQLKGDTEALNIAETQILQMASQREQGIKIMQTEAAAPVYAAMTGAREAGRIPSLNDIPREAWVNLQRTDPDKANDILKGIQTEVRADQERREVKQERNARRELVDEQKAQLRDQRRNFADLWGNPGTLATANLDALVAVGQLSPEQGKNLEERRKSANQDTLFTETREIERIMGAAKVKPKTEQADQIIGYIEQRKAAFKTDNGRAPKTSEVADMAREALYKVDVDWSPIDKPAYKMTLDDIPKDHRAAITAERTRRNLPTSDSDIISTYARGQARKAKGGK